MSFSQLNFINRLDAILYQSISEIENCLYFEQGLIEMIRLIQNKNLKTIIMAQQITMIESIGPAFKEKLGAAGVTTVEGLLEKGASKAGRKAIAEASGIAEGKILDWVNMADLFRIKGVGSQFAELLKAAGVDTVKELRNRNATNLHAALVKTQEEKGLTRAVPSESQVAGYVAAAKELEPMVTY